MEKQNLTNEDLKNINVDVNIVKMILNGEIEGRQKGDLSNVDLSGLDLENIDLSNANLTGTNVINTNSNIQQNGNNSIKNEEEKQLSAAIVAFNQQNARGK